MRFQRFKSPRELFVNFGQSLFHRGRVFAHLFAGLFCQGLRRAYTGHHIFTLGVDKEFAVICIFARRRVAGKGHACGRCLAHIPKDHGLDINRRTPCCRDVVKAAIDDSAFIHPASKDSINRALQLLTRVLGEVTAKLTLYCGFELLNHSGPILSRHLSIQHIAFIIFMTL